MTSGPVDLGPSRRIHLVGVGGAGMSGIARMLLQRGHDVSGTDLLESRTLHALRLMGARIQVGHDAAALGDAEIVVVSSAVPPGNPEVRAADERGLTVLHRSEMLAALMDGQRAVLISGTHGKTTTTSMTVVALQAAGLDPSFSIGGALNDAGSNAHAGTGDVFVAEADESDRSFLAYESDLAIVTNVELDHPDTFADLAAIEGSFRDFLARRRAGGIALCCTDDAGAAALAQAATPPVLTYGEDPAADVRLLVAADGTGRVRFADGGSVPLALRVPGRHNLLNAVAALAVCRWAGADLAAAADGLAAFTGAQRRFQRLGQQAGVDVVDDYAHHPTELRATLAAARSLGPRRILVVVQPHRYSRTAVLGAELGRAAAGADLVFITDVYGAGEPAVPGVSGALVADAARRAGARVRYVEHLSDVVPAVVADAQPGDLVLVTGAGDVTQVGPALLLALGDQP